MNQNTSMSQDIRWQQRFNNFNRAFSLLREIVEEKDDILSYWPSILLNGDKTE